jgi:hypothetical protein
MIQRAERISTKFDIPSTTKIAMEIVNRQMVIFYLLLSNSTICTKDYSKKRY